MEGLQKLKCGTCGTMFMSENGNTLCPSCLEGSTKGQSHEQVTKLDMEDVAAATNENLNHLFI